jgi:hypothetical protein
MIKIDKAWVGFLIGILLPLIGYVFVSLLNELLVKYVFIYGSGFSKKFTYILSVMVNMLPFLIAKRQRFDYQLQGIVGATLLWSLAVLFYIVKTFGF